MKRDRPFRPAFVTLESRWLPTAGPYPDIFRNAMQASFVAQANQASNPVVFLGDSITQLWGSSTNTAAPGSTVFNKDFAPLNAANFGIIGDTTQNLLARIDGGDLNGKPRVAVVMIGVNNLIGGATAAEAAAGVTSVVQAIQTQSPSTRILLLGVLPTEIGVLNPEIVELDNLISGLGQSPGVTYLNPGAGFSGLSNTANPALLRDVVHPDTAGYQVLESEIYGPIIKLLQESTGPVALSATLSATSTSSSAAKAAPVTQSASTPQPVSIVLIPLVSTDDATTLPAVQSSTSPASKATPAHSFATELLDVSTS